MAAVERSSLYVEGPHDVHVVHHLLLRHGSDCPISGDKRPQRRFAANVPEITPAGDKDSVLAAIGTAAASAMTDPWDSCSTPTRHHEIDGLRFAIGSGSLDSSCRPGFRMKDSSPILRTLKLALACG